MNKAYELEQLRQLLMSPGLKSGLYLLDTDLSDEDIEAFIKHQGFSSYVKESLFPSIEGSAFELFVIGLSYKCNDKVIDGLRGQLFTAEGKRKEIIISINQCICRLYRLFASVMISDAFARASKDSLGRKKTT